MSATGSSASSYQLSALRLQLLVAMAASDGRVLPVEVDRVARAIDDSRLDTESTARLEQLLRILLDSPPTIEQVVERIVAHAPQRKVAEMLVRELVYIARIDDYADEREEQLLRLVCGALRVPPSTVHRNQRVHPLDASERAQLDELLAAVASHDPAAR